MNCKPGDMAIIVSVPDQCVAHNIGRIVEVISLTTVHGLPTWLLKHPFKDTVNGWTGTCRGVADRNLQPIRPTRPFDEQLEDFCKAYDAKYPERCS